ncbi:MAG: TldD/PmbA family protein [Chloroflexi bacterium]|nr:TldD/PmbA family protein [Chloroflexota bacterium]
MMGHEHCQRILDVVLSRSSAEQTEGLLIAQDMQLIRFANNVIHQNVAETNTTLTVRADVGKRRGSATTNDLSDAAIERAAEQARAIALAGPEDPNLPEIPSPKGQIQNSKDQSSNPAFDDSTASCAPEFRAHAVGEVCRRAAEAGLNASGAFRTGTREWAVANSRGLRAYHAGTLADFVTTAMSDDSAGRAQASGWRVGDLDTSAAGAEASDKAARGRNPRPLPADEYPVVFDPYVTDDLLNMLAMHGMSAEAVQEGRSWMNDRIGQRVMSPAVTIWDDGDDPSGVPLPFDVEGVRRQRVDIVREGVACGPVHSSRTAARSGDPHVASTGHAEPPEYRRWNSGPIPLNLFMKTGDASVAEMIASTNAILREGLERG